mmetsp:Transcript_92809/g.199039  ORF Transcript_92809/g.199039 Transcript_92809/m.199039 type:complete len:353 (-) Transcript_92809:487-1545(-)
MVPEQIVEITVPRSQDQVGDTSCYALWQHGRYALPRGGEVNDVSVVYDVGLAQGGHDLLGFGLIDPRILRQALSSEVAVIRAWDLEEGEPRAGHLPIVVRLLDERREVRDTRGDVLDALTELLQKDAHMTDLGESVVGGQIHLALVLQGFGHAAQGSIWRVPHDRGLDLGFACRNDARVEVDLRCETQGVLEGVEEACATDDVAHPVVAIRRLTDPVEGRGNPLQPGQDPQILSLNLHKPNHGARVRVSNLHLPGIVGKDLQYLSLRILPRGAWEQQLGVQLLVLRSDGRNAAPGHFEAQHGHALATSVVPRIALQVRQAEVVVCILLELWPLLSRHFSTAGQLIKPAVRRS